MTDRQVTVTSPISPDLEREASEWFARLNAPAVSTAELEAFRVWRADPARRRAYEAVETAWRLSGDLAQDPDIRAATALAAAPSRRRVRPRRALLAAVAAVVVSGVVGAVLLTLPRATIYETGPGERRTVRLADGSELQLDAASRVRVSFTDARRDIDLEQGQALFDVETDATRPFRVLAGRTSVTATGTRFEVRRDLQGARVTLVEGAVVVAVGDDARATQSWRLRPGEQIATGGAARPSPRAVDVAAVTSWTEGRLVFDATPLAEAVAEVNRHAPAPIALAPGVDGRTPISGAFNAGDGRAFAEAVAALHGLRVESAADSLRLVPPSENNS